MMRTLRLVLLLGGAWALGVGCGLWCPLSRDAHAQEALSWDHDARDPELKRGIAQFYGESWTDRVASVRTLEAVVHRLPPGRELAIAYTFLGQSYRRVARPQKQLAMMRGAIKADPTITFEHDEYPDEVLACAAQARKELGVPTPPAQKPLKAFGPPVYWCGDRPNPVP